eukprot:10121135-Karenia_brevis.AAC.1
MAGSPEALDRAIDCLLTVLLEVFAKYQLTINWKAGKSEALLQYRGKHAHLYREKRRLPSGKLGIKLPDTASASILNVVSIYKHLGSKTTSNGSCVDEAHARVQAMMVSYGPLVSRVFTSKYFSNENKVSFANALCFSILFYNAHVWSQMTDTALKPLETAYMRVLRRLSGRVRGAEEAHISDLAV